MYQRLCYRIVPSLALTLAVLLVGTASLEAQQTGSVSGRVIDARTLQPIASAQVFIPDLNLGALTRQDGRYLLVNVPVGSHTVRSQLIGFRSADAQVTVAAGQTATADFQLQQDALALDEIVVTGTPGATQRRAIGNTVSTVEASNVVQEVAVTGMQDLLSGRTPGLQFTAAAGSVGTGSPIQIRGVGSFTGSREQPLVYVDGVRVNNNANAGPQLGEGRMVSVLDDFNPEDIESIEIIKGPAAASLYGTEASAGVIQIITKKGREGRPQFNVSIRQGTNFMLDPAGKLGTQWTCPTDPFPGPPYQDPTRTCETEDQLVSYNMYEEANRYIAEGYFPWRTENLYSNGRSQGYNLEVRGGAQAIRYYLSANHDREQGYVWWDQDHDTRLRANVSVLFGEFVTLDASTGYSDGWSRYEGAGIGDGGLWQDMIWSNGYYLNRITPFGTPARPGDPRSGADPRIGGFQEKLPTDVEEVEATRSFSRFTGSGTLNFAPPEMTFGANTLGLTSRAIVGLDRSWDVNQNLYPLEDGVVPEHLEQFLTTWDAKWRQTRFGEMTYERPITSQYTFDLAATANLQLGDLWGFATSAGAQYYINQLDRFQNRGTGFASTQSRTINQLAQPQMTTEYEFIENRSLGFYLQESVDYADRVFLTAAVRFDDNSTFGAEAPAQIYPKFSAAWVVSEEGFFNPLVDYVNSFRLRGAWGKAGRQPNALSGLNVYVPIPGPGGASAVRINQAGNPRIEPEVSTELELGFDVAFLEDRVSGLFTHYWRRDEQQLLQVNVPSSFGVPGEIEQNLGRIDNWGWEAQLSARLYESRALSFDLDLKADFTDNEIKDLGSFPGTNNIRIGLPFPNVTVQDWVVSAQFDPNAPAKGNYTNQFGKRLTALCDPGVSLAPEGAPIPAQYGVVPGGQPQNCTAIPDRNLYVGRAFATNTFGIAPRVSLLNNRLQLFALAEGQYGRWNTDNAHAWGHIYKNTKIARLENDAWWVASRLANGTSADFGRAIYDADFWKLREVGARYNLPESMTGRIGASNASIAFSARNLWILWQKQSEIWGSPITDPEFGDPTAFGGQGNFYSQPPLSSINLTLRASF